MVNVTQVQVEGIDVGTGEGEGGGGRGRGRVEGAQRTCCYISDLFIVIFPVVMT